MINFTRNDQNQWFDEGLRWLTMAAENGYAPSQHNLGQYYENTLISNQSNNTNHNLIDAKPLNTKTYGTLNRSQHSTTLVNQNNHKSNYTVAFEWYLKASAQGYVPSLVNIGKLKLKQKQYESAYYYFIEATRIGFGISNGIDSHITSYTDNKYVILPQFDVVGDSSLLQNNQSIHAWYYLGLMYEKGYFVVVNLHIAIKYYKKAAQYVCVYSCVFCSLLQL